MLCSWRLCSSPGMYAVTSLPLERRTRAILRRAELGFFGVMVLTCRHTPRFCGEASRSLTLLMRPRARRGFLMSWLIVGMTVLAFLFGDAEIARKLLKGPQMATRSRGLRDSTSGAIYRATRGLTRGRTGASSGGAADICSRPT